MSSKDDETYVALSNISPIIKEELDRYLQKGKKYSFEEQVALLALFVQTENRIPKSTEVYQQWNIGKWLTHQKQKMSSKDDEIYVDLSKLSPIVKEELDRFLSKKERS